MNQPDDSQTPPPELPINIDVHDVNQLLRNAHDQDSKDFLLLDCRELSEYETCKIEGATLVPMHSIVDRIDELESHRDQLIVVY